MEFFYLKISVMQGRVKHVQICVFFKGKDNKVKQKRTFTFFFCFKYSTEHQLKGKVLCYDYQV